MKTSNLISLFILGIVTSLGTAATAQDLLRVQGFGGPEHDQSINSVVDDDGNVYLSGTFASVVTFGLGGANETVLTSTPGSFYDMFLAKHDRDGELVWVKQVAGTGVVVPNGTALDGSGNILVVGAFGETATFGPGELNETSRTAVGWLDAFVAKFDNDGNFTWVETAGGPNLNTHQGVGTDAAGNSCVGGIFNTSMAFGATILTSAGDDIHLAKYDANGAFLWARAIGGAGRDHGYDVTADAAGNCYVSGEFAGTVVVDPGGPNETTLTTSGSGSDVLLAKYDGSGVLLWAKSATSSSCAGRELGRHVRVDGGGDVRVAGYFCGTPTVFGAGETNETALASAGGPWDIFIARYDASGNLRWAKGAGGPGGDQGVDVASDGLGNSYMTGWYDDATVFGAGEANEATLSTDGLHDTFVAKYDGGGDLLWVRKAGGADEDLGAGLDVDRLGDAHVTGSFSSEFATFGFGEANETVVATMGGYDGFLATFESTAIDKIDLLIAEIRRMQTAGTVGSGEGDNLVVVLQWARGSLALGLDNLAVLSLRFYALLTRIYVATGGIAPAEGQWLVDASAVIIDQINRT